MTFIVIIIIIIIIPSEDVLSVNRAKLQFFFTFNQRAQAYKDITATEVLTDCSRAAAFLL